MNTIITKDKKEIKPGYKKTSIGILPKDWEVKKLISQAYVDKENINSDFEDEFINYVSLSDIKNGKILPKKIQFKSAPSRAKRITKKGNVLLATVRPNLKNFAIVDKENIIASTGFAVLGYKKMDLVYLYNFLYSHFAEKQYFALTVGSNYPALNSNDVKNLNLPIPPLPEQKAIADCLSTWDKGIEKLSVLIASKKEQKKGLMQQLLTGKKRLDGFTKEWKEVKLGDVAHITTGSSNKQDAGHNLDYIFFDRSSDILTSDKYLFDCEAIIVPGEGADFIPKYFIGKFDLHQRAYSIMEFNNAYGKFIYYNLLDDRKHLHRQAVGSTVKSLRLPNFTNMPLLLPSINEQTAIAGVLTTADKEIKLLEKKLETFKTQKKGLMQVLLTGEKRLV